MLDNHRNETSVKVEKTLLKRIKPAAKAHGMTIKGFIKIASENYMKELSGGK